MSNKIKAIRGASSQVLGGFIQITIRLGGSMILARLLTPSDFGIFAIVTLIIGLFAQFSSLGATQAITAKCCISQKQLNSIFLLNIIIQFILSVVLLLLSSSIASFYNEQELSDILKIISFVTFFQSFSSVSGAILTKEMKFYYVNIIAILATIVEMGVAILLVIYYNYNFWALVWGLVAGNTMAVILLFLTARWRPTYTFSITSLKYYFRYGSHLMGENIALYSRQNIDYFIIGKLLNPTILGVYSFAYRIPNLVNARLLGPASGVITPYMAKLKNDKELIEAYFKFTKFIAYIGFLILVVLFVLAKPLILLMWGHQWHEAIEPMKILVGVSAISMLGLPLGSVFLKKSRPDLLFKTAMIKLPITFAIVLTMGYMDGIIGIAYGMLISTIVAFFISFLYLKKIISISTIQLFKTLFPVILSSFIGLVIGQVIDNFFDSSNYFIEIIIVSMIISMFYAITIVLLFKNDFYQIKSFILQTINKSKN